MKNIIYLILLGRPARPDFIRLGSYEYLREADGNLPKVRDFIAARKVSFRDVKKLLFSRSSEIPHDNNAMEEKFRLIINFIPKTERKKLKESGLASFSADLTNCFHDIVFLVDIYKDLVSRIKQPDVEHDGFFVCGSRIRNPAYLDFTPEALYTPKEILFDLAAITGIRLRSHIGRIADNDFSSDEIKVLVSKDFITKGRQSLRLNAHLTSRDFLGFMGFDPEKDAKQFEAILKGNIETSRDVSLYLGLGTLFESFGMYNMQKIYEPFRIAKDEAMQGNDDYNFLAFLKDPSACKLMSALITLMLEFPGQIDRIYATKSASKLKPVEFI